MPSLLYTYYRSSASYRVRIALNLKGRQVEQRFVDIAPGKTEQLLPEYAALNPQRLVPLFVDDGFALSQSLAIIEYLEELHPQPALLPEDARGRARVRALAYVVCCEVQPLQNTRVQRHLRRDLGQTDEAVSAWVKHWIDSGLIALEDLVTREREGGDFCYGAAPSLADVCLVPQLYNARRAGCDLTRYPTLIRIAEACGAIPAFRDAEPERQPDAP